MKAHEVFDSTTFFYNNKFLNVILDYKLTLDEFILLNYFLNLHLNTLNIEDVENITNLKSEMILEAYNGLIEKKIISISTITDDNGIISENISFENLFKKCDEVFNNQNKAKSIDDLKETFSKYSSSKISDNEIEIINAWINKGISINAILNAFELAKYNGVFNIRYIDKLLNENNKSDVNEDKDNHLFDYDWLDEK